MVQTVTTIGEACNKISHTLNDRAIRGVSPMELFAERGMVEDEALVFEAWVRANAATWLAGAQELDYEDRDAVNLYWTSTVTLLAFIAGYEYGKLKAGKGGE